MSKQKYPQVANTSADGTKAANKGREHYSHAKADARKDKRRQEAESRQREYDALSVQGKIARAKSRPGESKREVARLLAILSTPAKNTGTVPVVAVETKADGLVFPPTPSCRVVYVRDGVQYAGVMPTPQQQNIDLTDIASLSGQ